MLDREGKGGGPFWKIHGRVVLHGETKYRKGGFRNAFSSNLKTVNLNTVPKHGGIRT